MEPPDGFSFGRRARRPSFNTPNIVVAEAYDGAHFQTLEFKQGLLRVYKSLYALCISSWGAIPLYCRLTLSPSAMGSSKVLATRLDGGTAPSIDVPNLSRFSNSGYCTMRHPFASTFPSLPRLPA